MKPCYRVLSVLLLFTSAVAAQEAPVAALPAETTAPTTPGLSNKDILDMADSGLPPNVIVAKIKSSACEFDTAPASLKELKSKGVSDDVILAMVEAPVHRSKAVDPAAQTTTPSPTPAAQSPSDGKIRVLVTDSQSWEMRGGGSAGGNSNGWGASSSFSGGARPQTAEIIKTINERCPEIVVTNRLDKADFVLTLDHEGGKGALRKRNKIAVFNKDGDDIMSHSTRSLGNSVKDACEAILGAKH